MNDQNQLPFTKMSYQRLKINKEKSINPIHHMNKMSPSDQNILKRGTCHGNPIESTSILDKHDIATILREYPDELKKDRK